MQHNAGSFSERTEMERWDHGTSMGWSGKRPPGWAITQARRASPGFTMVELVIALLVFGVLIAASLGFMTNQSEALRKGMDRMAAITSMRVAVQMLELDLETLGTNVPQGQPPLVYAGENVVAFHADYATNVPDDPFAVYYDPDAPGGQVSAPRPSLVIPTTGWSYPDTLYEVGGAVSPAELITFYFESDTTTSRGDDFALFRQVNEADPELVARHLLRDGNKPFFRYLLQGDSVVDSIPDSGLPLRHSVPIHLSPADTGAAALIDTVRAVRVNLGATNDRSGGQEQKVFMSRIVRFPNAGLGVVESCGSPPILSVGLGSSVDTLGTGEPAVILSWNAAVDETGGEEDVIRYVIWRRTLPETDWGDPYLSIPAGAAPYTYTDAAVMPDSSYVYALAAQDCTPSLSTMASSGVNAIPPS